MKKVKAALTLALVLVIGPLTSGCTIPVGLITQILGSVGSMLTSSAQQPAAATAAAPAAADTAETASQTQQPEQQQKLAQFEQTPEAPQVQGQ